MWFKMSQKIIDSPVSLDLGKSMYNGDSRSFERLWGFSALLCKTADGAACNLRDARDLACLTRISDKQAEIVWDVLTKHGVLRADDGGGYSCTQWMKDAGIVGEKKRKEVIQAEPQRVPKPTDNPLAAAFSAGFGNGGRTSFA